MIEEKKKLLQEAFFWIDERLDFLVKSGFASVKKSEYYHFYDREGCYAGSDIWENYHKSPEKILSKVSYEELKQALIASGKLKELEEVKK